MIEVLCVGDSITANPYMHGQMVNPLDPYIPGYGEILQDLLGSGYHVVRYGIGGAQSSVIRDLARYAAAGKRRDWIVWAGGSNDVNASVAAATQQGVYEGFESDMAAFGQGAQIITCTIPPSAQFSAPQDAILAEQNTWYRDTYPTQIVDRWQALVDPDDTTSLHPNYLIATEPADVIHPNEAGSRVVAALIYARILAG